MKKLAAVVVLYNPVIDQIEKNIKTYIDNVDKLFVVDNSDTNVHSNDLKLKILNKFDNIEYINNNKNIGIASALNIGCKKAKELDYNWILTMDQDSGFINFSDYINCLELLENDSDSKDIAIIAANAHRNIKERFDKNSTSICKQKDEFSVITSGNLLNLKLYNEIGGFEDKLFIDVVDFDYCIKAKALNYRIILLENIFLEHELGDLTEVTNLFSRKKKFKRQHNHIRLYYFIRNYLFLWSKYKNVFPDRFNIRKVFLGLIVHKFSKIIIYEDNKMKKLNSLFLAIYHFATDRYGKY